MNTRTSYGLRKSRNTLSEEGKVLHVIMSHLPRREYNIVVLGAGGVGKSCLTARFVQDVWIESYDPTIEDSYRKQVAIDGKQVILEILDTAGTEQFTAMRELYMKQGQGFLLVFSITSSNSFQELAQLRESITRIKEDQDVPIVIVGNKCDMPEDDRVVSRTAAFQLAQSWQKPYFESSAKTRRNVEEVFISLCRQIIEKDTARQELYNLQFNRSTAHSRSADTRKRRKRRRERCEIL